MSAKIADYQVKVLKALAGKIDDFYLLGGTALSLYYFHHRESMDLDFFTQEFSKARIFEIIKFLSASLGKRINLVAQRIQKDRVKILVYSIEIGGGKTLKMDFVQDYHHLVKSPEPINGIKVSSLEDIYIRKIYAVSGVLQTEDLVGRKIFRGGRQEAKDFYDLYCLSHTFMRLSDFSFRFCDQLIREGLIRWFRTYSRLDMKTGLLELRLKKNIDYYDIERHFKKEIDKILEKEVDFI